jgi:hypothetical protein
VDTTSNDLGYTGRPGCLPSGSSPEKVEIRSAVIGLQRNKVAKASKV